MMGPILIAGEDAGRRNRLGSTLLSSGYRIIEAESGYRALDLLRRRPNISLALVELEMSDISSVDFIASIRGAGVKAPLIAIVSSEGDERLNHAMNSGASDFLVLPVSPLRLTVSVGNLLQRHILDSKMQFLRRHSTNRLSFDDLTVKSQVMQVLVREAKNAARSRKSLLITGEVGTGREALARIIHNESVAEEGPFVQIRCSYQLDETFLSQDWPDELAAKFQEARGGTVLLSDVDVLDMTFQSQLLQALERQNRVIKSSPESGFRLVATASAHLGELVGEGSFLGGLFRKLDEIGLKLPPLRSRREDISEIAHLIVTRIITEIGNARINGISGGAMALLLQYDWPGNISELENILFRAILFSNGPLLSVQDFPQLVQRNEDRKKVHSQPLQVFFNSSGHIQPLAVIEKDVIAEAMKRYRGKISEVARRLGIGRSTLYRKLEDYDVRTDKDQIL